MNLPRFFERIRERKNLLITDIKINLSDWTTPPSTENDLNKTDQNDNDGKKKINTTNRKAGEL